MVLQRVADRLVDFAKPFQTTLTNQLLHEASVAAQASALDGAGGDGCLAPLLEDTGPAAVADPAAAAPSQAWPRAEAAGSGTEVEVGEVRGSHLRPRRRRQGYPATCPPLCPRLVYHAGSPLRAEGEGAFPGYQGRGFLGSPGSPGSHPPL